MKRLISIIIPVYNEDENLDLLHSSLIKVLNNLKKKYDYEIIFINDGSIDKSGILIEHLAKKDKKIKSIEFSRNFGKEMATSAGLHYSKGDAVIILDADLQHPLELIPKFIEKWEDGFEMVVGIRNKNNGEGFVKKLGSFFFYKITNAIGEIKIIPGATDYRLVDKKVVREFNKITEQQRITRGLLDWLGFKKDYIYFTANPRQAGKPGYSTEKLIKLAIASFVSNSLFPLKIAGYLGIIITASSGIIGLFIFIEKYLLDDPWNLNISGIAILAIIILFLVGIILICLGLIALYIANIQAEVVNKPMYVIGKKENL